MRYPANDAFRAAVFWSFNDEMQLDRLKNQLDKLMEGGLLGGFLHTRVGLMTPYLSDAWMETIEGICRYAREKGTQLWLYDEDRWPSGYGGGEVTQKYPELAAGALCLVPEADAGKWAEAPCLGGFERDETRYRLLFIQKRNGENPWFSGGAYVDFLNPESIEKFLELVHERYRKWVGKYFGKELAGVFFDEPCYIQRGPYACVPYTKGFGRRFYETYGYRIEPRLSELFFDEGEYRRLRLDFYALATRLFVEGFVRPYHDWCRKNGLLLTGHMLGEDTLTAQVEGIGAAMPHYAHMDIPGIDKLGLGNDKLLTVLQLTSVAEQLKKRCLCEALGCIGHQSGPEAMKSLTDWLSALGISFINPHLTLYSMRGERKRDYPPNISWMQPWFAVSRGYFDHVARVCEAVWQGECTVDLLVIHPMSSVWAEISPLHKPNPVFSIWDTVRENARSNYLREVEEFQKPFLDLSERLMEKGLAHHYGDETLMAQYGRAEDGRLFVGEVGYKTVIVPPVSVLKSSTMELLKRFSEQAGPGAVVFMERYPQWIQGEKGAGDCADWATLAPDVHQAIQYARERADRGISLMDISTGEWPETIIANVRRVEGGLRIFLANTGERPVRMELALERAQPTMAVDTVDGEVYALPDGPGAKAWTMELKQSGSLLLIPGKAQWRTPVASLFKSGADFRGRLRFMGSERPGGTPLRSNLMPLDRVDFTAGAIDERDVPVESLWSRFYALNEGTPFVMSYRFEVFKRPASPMWVMVEMARYLDQIELNGQKLEIEAQAAEQDCFDFNFDRLRLEGLREGENELKLWGKKYNNIIAMATHRALEPGEEMRAAELEAAYLVGRFKVELTQNGPVIAGDAWDEVRESAEQAGYPFYCGELEYEVICPEGARWMRIEADANAASLESHGKRQIAYIAPFEFDLDGYGAGERIKIRLYNSLANSFGPIHLYGRNRLKMLGPGLIYNSRLYTPKAELFPFGVKNVQFYK